MKETQSPFRNMKSLREDGGRISIEKYPLNLIIFRELIIFSRIEMIFKLKL